MPANDPTGLSTRFFARQPVFDSKQLTWGYHVTFGRTAGNHGMEFVDSADTSLDLAAGMLTLADALFGRGRNVIINFGEHSILDETPYALPANRTVLEIPSADQLPGTSEAPLREFVADGFTIAMDAIEAEQSLPGIRSAATMLTVDVTGRSSGDLAPLLASMRREGDLVLARGVNGVADMATAREVGADLYQGAYFQTMETVASRKPTSHEASRFKLLGAIEKPDPDFDALTEAIQHDAAISYRLLSYLNSPAFGFTDRITSIKQAILLLGWKQLKNWLRVVIITDINPDPETRQLLIQSVQRGKFFQLTAASQPTRQDDPDAIFLLGLFSLLEPMLKIPIQEVVDHLPLTPELTCALLGETDNRCALWLRLAQAYECSDWTGLDELIDRLGLHPLTVSVAYYKSIMWTETFFSQG